MKRFAAAWRFLTVFPFPLPPGDDEGGNLRDSAVMFPFVGIVLGIIAAAVAWFFCHIFSSLAVAALTVAVLAMFSVGLHLDGVCDCGDALMTPGRDRDTALAIMKDSRVGAHGALALFLLLLVKFAALASVANPVVAALVIPIGGRAAMLFSLNMLGYVRKEGLGKLFSAGRGAVAVGAIVTAIALVSALGWIRGGVGLALWLAASLGWVGFLRLRLGGATGDGYGAACEIGETATALAFATNVCLQC